jgi:hypothetical protein
MAVLVLLDLLEAAVSWHLHIPSNFNRIDQISGEADFKCCLGPSVSIPQNHQLDTLGVVN